MRRSITLLMTALCSGIAAKAALINEVKVNPPTSTDYPYEYIELVGAPNESLACMYLVAVDGDLSDAGKADIVVNLNGQTLGANGLLMITALAGGHTAPAATPLVRYLSTTRNLENNSFSFLLIQAPVAPTEGTDYDDDNNGVFDDPPLEGAVILDAVGWTDNDAGDIVYGSVNLTIPGSTPDAATRCAGDITPRSAPSWYRGDLGGSVNTSTDYSPDPVPGDALTPGDVNVPAQSGITFTPAFFSGVVGDAAACFAVSISSDMSSTTMTGTSANQAVVPNANIVITPATGTSRNVCITPIAVGYDVAITLTIGSHSRLIRFSASAGGGPNVKFHTGMADASGAVPVGPGYMFAGDDEPPTYINLYSTAASGGPVRQYNFTCSLGLASAHPEADIEGAIRVTSVSPALDRIYWISSLGNGGNSPFEARPNRNRFFATDITGSGSSATLTFRGYYNQLREDLIARDAGGWGAGLDYDFDLSAASGREPKELYGRGFNVEALSSRPSSTTTAYIGMRAPLVPAELGAVNTPPAAGTRVRALVIPIANIDQYVTGSPTTAQPIGNLGTPIELDLSGPYGGRGIRTMEYINGTYVIIAGRPGPADGAPGEFALFTWPGTGSATEWSVNLSGLNPEAVVEQVGTGPFQNGSQLRIVSDNGVTQWYNNGIDSKNLPFAEWKKFRSDIITLGPKASVQYNWATLENTTQDGTCCGSLSDLESGFSEGFAINNNDAITGISHNQQNQFLIGFVWKKAPNPWNASNWQQLFSNGGKGYDVNDSYLTAGYWLTLGREEGIIWDYSTTAPIDYTVLSPSVNIIPRGINEGGIAAGSYYTSSGGIVHGFYWNGSVLSLNPLPSSLFGGQTVNQTIAHGINNRNQIVGSSGVSGGSIFACVWEPPYSTPIDLPRLPSGGNSEAFAINDMGTIVGYAVNSAGYRRACAWTRVGSSYQIFDLGILPGQPATRHSEAKAINNRGQIVGYCEVLIGWPHAVSWINGKIFRLNDRAINLGNRSFLTANGINDSGKITGQIHITGGLTPCPTFSCYKAYILSPIN
jgi:probable HAF family extracellular repeat protein